MTNRCKRGAPILLLAAAAAIPVLWPLHDPPAPAQDNPTAASNDQPEPTGGSAVRGRNAFRIYCASCHGATAKGNGPVGSYLKIPPSDLTRLAVRNKGDFPADRVYSIIDGRDSAVPTHGTRDMPVWGLSFQTTGKDTDQEGEVRGRILDLVAFLKSIQGSAAK
jgi:mono/diheme cytochrome c family protein